MLELLKVPVNSQTLVFSKTSFQYPKISPEHPRALYYNDDVYVGAVHDGKAIEIISFDPRAGRDLLLLDEQKADKPRFQRAELDCTQCHIAAGHARHSGRAAAVGLSGADGHAGRRAAPSYITDQKSPLKRALGRLVRHRGAGGRDDGECGRRRTPPAPDSSRRARRRSCAVGQAVDASAYLAPGSDQVALLVLAHQTQMHNLITLTNYQTRLALCTRSDRRQAARRRSALDALPEATRQQIETPGRATAALPAVLERDIAWRPGRAEGDRLVRLRARVRRARAARSKGRSLRDFDLHDRIFRYPCSYLIYSAAFDALPEPAKGYVYHRLLQVLSGQDQSADFASLSAQDRQAILSILLETKPGLPAEWQDYARSNHLQLAARAQPPQHQ